MKARILTMTAIVAGSFLLPGTAAELQAQRSGAELWGTTCTRCHNARPVSERTDREWATIVNHMRARANLTKSGAQAILEFLQATNAPEAGAVSQASPEAATASEDRDWPRTTAERATLDTLRLQELIVAYLQRMMLIEAPLP